MRWLYGLGRAGTERLSSCILNWGDTWYTHAWGTCTYNIRVWHAKRWCDWQETENANKITSGRYRNSIWYVLSFPWNTTWNRELFAFTYGIMPLATNFLTTECMFINLISTHLFGPISKQTFPGSFEVEVQNYKPYHVHAWLEFKYAHSIPY